ncbi:MAG: hypothetical protein JWN39_3555, partial [Ilumatobacteraceae bacterium]|nr:hypothetical protein [Ilumatobacteraceae bacterium]
TGAQGSGFVTVYPCGSDRPTTSNQNFTAGDTIPNAVITKIGVGGKVCLFTSVATHLLADVNGYFPAGSSYSPIVPARLLDTRQDPSSTTIDGGGLGSGLVGGGQTLELQVGGRGGVPADASAAVLNVTVTGGASNGFVTVYPCGADRPTTSNLNFGVGQTIPNAVIAKIGAAGKVCLFTNAATHLLADVNGFFPAGSTYSPLVPGRVLDTRQDPSATTIDGVGLGHGLVAGGETIEVPVAGRAGVPATASAVVLNVTVTGPTASGFITVYPCGADRPNSSNLNFTVGQTIPNAVIAKVGVAGTVCLYTNTATHLLVDTNGYFPA